MEFCTSKEMAAIWEITPRRIQMLCANGDIPGAMKLGRDWLIPKTAARPADCRRKDFRSAMHGGFTLIEMLVVIAIISILVSVVIPTVSSATERAGESADAANIRSAYSKVMIQAVTGEASEVCSSEPIQLRQKNAGWQDDTVRTSLSNLGAEIGSPAKGGSAVVEYHQNAQNGAPGVIIRYSDSGGAASINYSSSQSVGKYVFSEVSNQLLSIKNGAADSDFTGVFTTKYDKTQTSQMTLPNGSVVNVIVHSRNYDTFQDVKTRISEPNTATLIYNRVSGELSTIIYYDGTQYSTWSVDSDYTGWSADDAWTENSYNGK